MKKKTKLIAFIVTLSLFLIASYFVFFDRYFSHVLTNAGQTFLYFFMISGLLLILTGIPALIRKIKKLSPNFILSYIFGLILFIEFSLNQILFHKIGLFNLNSFILNLILTVKFFLYCILIVIHVFFFKKAGFFYHKVLIIIIEKIFHIRIALDPSFYKTETQSEPSESAVKKENKLISAIKKIYSFNKNIANIIKLNIKKIGIALLVLLGIFIIIFGIIIGYGVYKNNLLVKIKSIDPVGYSSQKNVIKIIWDAEIDFKDTASPGRVLNINPDIQGDYLIEGGTLTFVPKNDLPLSAKYKVSIDTSKLVLKNKTNKVLQGSNFEFHTTLMEVADTSFYFNINKKTKRPESLTGEIRFSLPVDIDSLKERIEIKFNGKSFVPDSFEISGREDIVYFKINDIKHEFEDMNIDVKLKEGVKPKTGILATDKKFEKRIMLKGREKLAVESLETFPVVGNTYIAVKFNMPVDEKTIAKFISIEPVTAYKITSEYRYIILESNFKPNFEYNIKISKDLSSLDGSPMKEDYISAVVIQDMNPYIKFTSDGKILPMTDNMNVEFVSLNLDSVKLTVDKIYKNNIVNYLMSDVSYSREEYNEDPYYDNYSSNRNLHFLHNKTFNITGGNINEEVKNLINLKTMFNSDYQGVYNLRLSDPVTNTNYSSMTVNITNMGLIIKNDGRNLHVFAVNILNLTPMPNVKLSLISRENQILNESYTDFSGKAVFSNYRLTKENLEPYLVYAENGNDFTFLVLNRNTLDYSTFNVSGNDFTNNKLDAFIKTERGVYRPGDNVYATLILRKSNLDYAETVPLIVKVKDTTGKAVYEKAVKTEQSGVMSLNIPTEYQYKTGDYQIEVYQDNTNMIGYADFKIEEFIPYNIEVKVKLLENSGNKIRFKVISNELHGARSKGLKVAATVIFKSAKFENKNFEDYNFYDMMKSDFNEVIENLGESILDDNGEKEFTVNLPDSIDPPSAIRAVIYADVFDSTGRPVSDSINADMHKYSSYYGIRLSQEHPFNVNKQLKFKYLSINKDGKFINGEEVEIKIERKVWYSIFKKFSWTKKFSSEYYHEIVYEDTVKTNNIQEIGFVPDKGGQYTVSISKKDGMTSNLSFYVNDSNYTAQMDMSEPYKLVMNLDKSSYSIGETGYLTVIAPFSGKIVICFERETIYQTMIIDLINNKAVVPFTVNSDFIPNMYITAVAYRKPQYELMSMPPVSYGAVNIKLDKNKLAQNIVINTSPKIRSSDGLKININIPGGAGSKVVIAAVDEGILQITGYARPDAYDYFYRKRKLAVSTQTSLKDILPDIYPYKKAFGGGGMFDEMERRHLNPVIAKRVKSMSLYSGILECDEAGNVSHSFKMDQFNGKVRVMVLSVKGKTFGSAQSSVTVSDPIVIVPGIPRIMAPQDKSVIPVKIFNKTGKDGKFTVTVELKGPVKLEGNNKYEISVANEGEKEFKFTVIGADDAGVANIRINAEGNNEFSFSETEFAVRPAAPLYTTVNQGAIGQGSEKIIKEDVKLIKQGQFKQMIISGDKIIRAMGALEYLIQYPYGCSEQTASAAFPLLYLKSYAKSSSVFQKNDYLIDKYITAAIDKLEGRMTDSGDFYFWQNQGINYWVSDYVAHFLIEARNSGYPITEQTYSVILKKLGIVEEISKPKLDRRFDNVSVNSYNSTYKLYLRSLIGKPDFDALRSYYDKLKDKNKVKELTEKDRCFLASAYALAGDKQKAAEFLPDSYLITTLYRSYDGYFDSYVRNTALYLYSVSLINPDNKRIPILENQLYEKLTKNGGFGSTQDTAWALFALGHLRNIKKEKVNVEIYANGKLVKTINEETIINSDELNFTEFTIKNKGQSDCYFYYASFGYPLFPDNKKVTNGFEVTKEYLDINGKAIDIRNVKQGEKIVVTLTVKNKTKNTVDSVILLDLLPAGFEIENTRLSSRGDYSNIPENYIEIDYQDIRDDRIIISCSKITDTIRFSYAVNAVSPGEYTVPQFQAEAMYDPEIFGKSGAESKLVIIKKD